MKLVREHINEKFTQESDPLKDMNIGEINRIRKSLKEFGIPETDIEIDDNFEIYYKRGFSKPYGLIQLQLQQLSPEKRTFVQEISRLQNKQYGPTVDPQAEFQKNIQDALNNGISSKDIRKLVNEFGDEHQKKILTIPLTKMTRTKQKVKEDEENNLYVFIGYTEKSPVTINGEKYYKDKLQAEKLVKIDRYNLRDLQMVSMMKLRAQVQYGHKEEGAVYMIYVPKDFMDEESYDGIPDEYRYIIEKYKKKI